MFWPGLQGADSCAIDDPMTVADVKAEAYKLPDSFEWSSCDLTDAKCKVGTRSY
jgi:hypothetical protein